MKSSLHLIAVLLLVAAGANAAEPSEKQLANWLKRFPDADANKDGKLSLQEAEAYRQKMAGDDTPKTSRKSGGVPREYDVDPGWNAERFPDHAVCYRTPEEIKALNAGKIQSYPKQENGVLRIVGTGHSFMAPGYQTFPKICRAAGFEQPLFTHTGGGITGSARYKWEQENGIFEFDGEPTPKLLASIANAEWDAMMWGPYYNERPAYYKCWMDFCLKFHPHMKFYLSDAWPQLNQFDEAPKSEDALTAEAFNRFGEDKNVTYGALSDQMNELFPGKFFILPTADAMVLAVQHFHRGELPGIEGINKSVGGKERSIWRDELGHLGPGFDRLEGYVFYATIYQRSPELLDGDAEFGERGTDFPSRELDRVFRKIAWQAVIGNPNSGVTDLNGDGVGDTPE